MFSVESLAALIGDQFDVLTLDDDYPPHSQGRICSTRIVARKKPGPVQALDKEAILRAYESQLDPSDPA